MKMTRKFFFGWLGFIAIVAGLAAFGWHWLDSGFDLCEDAVMQKAPSPDGRLTAIVYSEDSENSQPQVSVQWQGNKSLLVQDNPSITSRITFSQKRVTADLGWFRSAHIAVHYADLPLPQKTKH